jgi:hypothetical protein
MVKCDRDFHMRERVVVSARGSVYSKFIKRNYGNISYTTVRDSSFLDFSRYLNYCII